MGITQHKHSVATVRESVNLQLLFGQLGKPGAGLCPVRGHNNVQGNRTMGIDEKQSAALLDSLAAHFAFTPPRGVGHNTVQAIEAMLRDEVKVLITLGGNLAAAAHRGRAAALHADRAYQYQTQPQPSGSRP